MLCQICKAIDFRSLPEWKRSKDEISDESNKAFQWRYISETALEQWQIGEGPVQMYYFHHTTTNDLIKSAANGCQLCAILTFNLLQDNPILDKVELSLPPCAPLEKPVVMMLYVPQGCMSWRNVSRGEFIRVFCGPFECHLESIERFSHEQQSLNKDFYVDHCHGFELAWEKGDIDLYMSTWSSRNLQLAKSWRKYCRENHVFCSQTQNFLPYRVIDLGESGLDANPTLYEPPAQTRGDYVTLSYCWGHSSNMSISPIAHDHTSHRELPPIKQWPKLFQDAIAVTRDFEIRYLWIDALCILQDSSLDWEVESGKMAQYYRNAAFTIAAAATRDNSASLFSFRNPILVYPHHLVLQPSEAGSPIFERYLCAGGTDLCTPYEFENEPNTSSLHSRGWVLQEELLSTRILKFGRRGIYWECFGSQRSEGVVRDWSKNDATLQEHSKYPMRVAFKTHDSGWVRQRSGHHETWYQILGMFNKRNITHKDDVLPALSGIADTLYPFLGLGEQYLAGIWKQDLTIGLLWCRGPTLNTFRRAVSPHQVNFCAEVNSFAPSWSWISLAHKRLNFKLHPKILTPFGVLLNELPETHLVFAEVEIQNKSAPFGRVKSGTLRFSAQCPNITVFLNSKPTVPVATEIEVLESRDVGYESLPYRKLEMERTGFDSKDWYLGGSPDEPFTGDCILDRDEDEFLHEKDAVQWLRPGNVSEGLLWRAMKVFRRQVPVLHAILLPLLHYKTEVYRENIPSDRTLGLVLIPVPNSGGGTDGSSTQTAPPCYRRIGRAAVNIDYVRWMSATCQLPMQEISII